MFTVYTHLFTVFVVESTSAMPGVWWRGFDNFRRSYLNYRFHRLRHLLRSDDILRWFFGRTFFTFSLRPVTFTEHAFSAKCSVIDATRTVPLSIS